MRKALIAAGAALAVLLLVMLVRTLRFRPREIEAPPAAAVVIDSGAAPRLAGALRIATISREDSTTADDGAFLALHAYLRRSFPRVHEVLRTETVAGHSLLYRWSGSDTSLAPVLLAAHLDVVPVEPGTEAAWTHPPFAGTIADGFIWGRGAIDNKSAVVGTLEAVEMLLKEGFQPRRTMYLAFGHDEEVGGTRGARAIAAELGRRGVRLEMVLDEGGVIGDGLLPGVSRPTALIGVAEKGFASVELTVRTDGGHSSLPPRQSAIGILGAGIARLESRQPTPRIAGASERLFATVGPHFGIGQRLAFANLWLMHPLVATQLAKAPATNAMVRTTTAATIFQAGTKDNVLPSQSRAVVNFRIIQGDSVAGVVDRVRRVVDDERIEVRLAGRFSAEPSAVSSTESPAYQLVARSVRSVAPEAIVAPYLVVVVSDARYYAGISESVFRFLPVTLGQRDLARMHGTDERLAIGDYERAIRIYREIMLTVAGR